MINSIEIQGKEWFDKINGNSYFSAVITLNDKETIKIPFQYGYGSSYIQECKRVLTEHNKISASDHVPLSRYCNENNILFNATIKSNCKKKELKNN